MTLMKPGALPLIVLNGDNSSPSFPEGTGKHKSKSIVSTKLSRARRQPTGHTGERRRAYGCTLPVATPTLIRTWLSMQGRALFTRDILHPHQSCRNARSKVQMTEWFISSERRIQRNFSRCAHGNGGEYFLTYTLCLKKWYHPTIISTIIVRFQ